MTTKTLEPHIADFEKQFDAKQPVPKQPITAVSIILSKGNLDMVYPALILANGARMSGIEATIFFTFWGLDAITEKKIDNLHVATVGNPAFPIPTLLGGLPGIESLASAYMKHEIEKIEIPGIREMLQILSDSGAKLYACRMAMDMFGLKEADLIPAVNGVLSVIDFFELAAGSQLLFI
ncbi:MAG: DsrE/DsrF/DrsH-like family protein [Thermoanaerobaculia bacterium]